MKEHDLYRPITHVPSVEGWKNVPISECGEKLVSLSNPGSNKIKVAPAYYHAGIDHAIADCLCRESLLEKLLQAAELLPSGLSFLVLDAWRPIGVQKALYDDFKEKIQRQKTYLDEAALNEEVQKYVSLPSTDALCPSPHITGGSIDLTIQDEKGEQLDMGTRFDYFGIAAKTEYFEGRSFLTEAEKTQRDHRRILYHSMITVGFTNYHEEWWHYDYGNQFWGVQNQKEAIYGLKNDVSL